jgi:hypothetical protein
LAVLLDSQVVSRWCWRFLCGDYKRLWRCSLSFAWWTGNWGCVGRIGASFLGRWHIVRGVVDSEPDVVAMVAGAVGGAAVAVAVAVGIEVVGGVRSLDTGIRPASSVDRSRAFGKVTM